MHPRLAALLAGAALVGVAIAQLARGPETAPGPLVEIGIWWLGHPADELGRLVTALTLGLGLATAAVGTRFLALASAGLAAFVSLACLSYTSRAAGLLSSSAVACAAMLALFLFIASLASRSQAPEPSTPRRRGLGSAWGALAAIAIAAVGAAAVAPARIAAITTRLASEEVSESGASATDTVVSIDLDMHPFVGRRLKDTPVGAAMPELAAELDAESDVESDAESNVGGTEAGSTERVYLVFYNPQCSSCRGIFEEHFATPRTETVIAIMVPPAGNDAPNGDAGLEPSDIPCASCRFESLPVGPNWIVASPMTIVVEDGVVRCVADRVAGDCLNPQE